MMNPDPAIEHQLALAFAPLDKRALGFGFGAAFSLLLTVVSIVSLVVDPSHNFPLGLLNLYFYGYDLTAFGILIGALWAFVTGFFWGWFGAFTRNFVFAFWLMLLRIRSDFSTSRDFLDHI